MIRKAPPAPTPRELAARWWRRGMERHYVAETLGETPGAGIVQLEGRFFRGCSRDLNRALDAQAQMACDETITAQSFDGDIYEMNARTGERVEDEPRDSDEAKTAAMSEALQLALSRMRRDFRLFMERPNRDPDNVEKEMRDYLAAIRAAEKVGRRPDDDAPNWLNAIIDEEKDL